MCLHEIQKKIKNVPHNGLSYGVLRYLVKNEKIRMAMEKLPHAEIAFNYHGQLDNIQERVKPFSMLKFPIANSKNISVTRSHLINIDAVIFNKKLSITLSYSKDFHRMETMRNYGSLILSEIKKVLVLATEQVDE